MQDVRDTSKLTFSLVHKSLLLNHHGIKYMKGPSNRYLTNRYASKLSINKILDLGF